MARRVRTIIVDSRQRDKRAYPSPNSYVVKLSEELRNVESLELVYAIYPTFGTESYVNLFVSELEERGSVVTLDSAEVGGAFTQLPLIHPVNEYTPARHFRSISSFRIPLARLSRLTLRFTDAFGVPYVIQDHFLRFEAVCLERQRQRESDLVQSLPARDHSSISYVAHVPAHNVGSCVGAVAGEFASAGAGAKNGDRAMLGATPCATPGAIPGAAPFSSHAAASSATSGAASGATLSSKALTEAHAIRQLALSLNELMVGDGGRRASRRKSRQNVV